MNTFDIEGLNKVAENILKGLEKRERLENKITEITESSTNEEYPSAAAVREYVKSAILEALNTLNT